MEQYPEDMVEYFSIVQTPMGSGGISGHSFSRPQQPPILSGPSGNVQFQRPPHPPPIQQQQSSFQVHHPPTYYHKWRPQKDRLRYYWNPYSNYQYYYPYYYYPNYYYSNPDNEKCFCQDNNLLGALPDKMICGQKGCGVCIDRYLCENCNENVSCKRYY